MSQYALKLEMEVEEVQGNNRTSTGQKVVFTSFPTDLESAVKAWYIKLQLLSGCGCEPTQMNTAQVDAFAKRFIDLLDK